MNNRYNFISWIVTDSWEGALIEDCKGEQFLTSGVYKWGVKDRRYKRIDNIKNKNTFIKRWKENFPYFRIVNLK